MADITPLLALFGAIFIGLASIRLLYIEPQLDNLTDQSKDQKKYADDALSTELKRKQPEKEKVLSLANEIAAQNRLEKNIRDSSGGNRLQVLLDIGAVVSIGVLGFAVDYNALSSSQQLLGALCFLLGSFSIATFFERYLYVHSLKKRMNSEKKN